MDFCWCGDAIEHSVKPRVDIQMEYLLGIDLGGSSVKAAVLSLEGRRILTRRADFEAEAPFEWGRCVRSMVTEVESSLGHPARSVGLAAPGLVSPSGRCIWHMPGRLRGLENLDWTDYLKRSHSVWVMNDAQAALAGEAWLGAVRNARNILFLTLGTGVGGAAMVDGRILRGAVGRAGHAGHICLNPDGAPDICRTPGSLELAVGDCAVPQRSGGRFKTTQALLDAARNGDSTAASIWSESVRNLACGLVSLSNVLDPETIVIGGGIARAGGDLFKPLQKFMDELEWIVPGHRVSIQPARLGEMAGACGAAITAFQQRKTNSA